MNSQQAIACLIRARTCIKGIGPGRTPAENHKLGCLACELINQVLTELKDEMARELVAEFGPLQRAAND